MSAAVRRRRRPRLRLEVQDRGRPRVDRAFAALHAAHLGDATATDVISFALDDGAEIVVSKETARRVARESGHTTRAEIALYIVHGILHTTGFDDVRARDRVRMREAEREVMRRLRLSVRAVDA